MFGSWWARAAANVIRNGPGCIVCLALVCALAAVPVAAQEGTPVPQDGGTLVVSIASDPGHFNPAITTGFT